MISARSWNDMEQFGIIPLTGESCAYSLRLLCDLTAQGRALIRSFFGLRAEPEPGSGSVFQEPWNRGSAEDPHVASILLPYGLFITLSTYTLLRKGMAVFVMEGASSVLGYEPDSDEHKEAAFCTENDRSGYWRGPKAGSDRNLHHMSGRTE